MRDSERILGLTIKVKGELTANEDLTFGGQIEGLVDLNDRELVVAPSAVLNAQVCAGSVVVRGTVTGNIMAKRRVEIAAEGQVHGDITSPAVVIAEGGTFQGRIEMPRQTPARRAAAQAVDQLLSA
jgi:cytoskeletal protein CcmA (bactofilin family)